MSKCPECDTNWASVIVSNTQTWLDETGTSQSEFAQKCLLPLLEDADFISTKHLKETKPYERWMATWRRRIERIMSDSDSTPMPTEFALHWVSVLPEKHQNRCKHQLAACLGTLYTPLEFAGPRSRATEIRSRLDVLAKEFADVMQHLGPGIDGQYDGNDDPVEVQHLADELHELGAAVYAELGRINLGTGIRPTMIQLMNNSPLFKE